MYVWFLEGFSDCLGYRITLKVMANAYANADASADADTNATWNPISNNFNSVQNLRLLETAYTEF
jgi:hypothetical protein